MPEAARVRSVSFRPRAPHSLRTIESTLAMASLTERDSERIVTEMATNVKLNLRKEDKCTLFVLLTSLWDNRRRYPEKWMGSWALDRKLNGPTPLLILGSGAPR
jgi:hypothetical protein